MGGDTDRVIGALLEFKNSTERGFDKVEARFESVDVRFDRLEEKVERISNWRIKVTGGAAALITLVELVHVFLK